MLVLLSFAGDTSFLPSRPQLSAFPTVLLEGVTVVLDKDKYRLLSALKTVPPSSAAALSVS